ncbi:MAG TPA: metalloregulator ArsR/SmtB family transcription factor [Acidimicrobiia bacterium]|jgi:DNA-binding transcriptional ArsR family regulator
MRPADVDSAFRALADPTRRRILRLVAGRTLTAGEIAAHFQTSRPGISQHLKVLKEAGLLSESRDGTRRRYQTQTKSVEAVIDHLRSLWPARLQALKREAEREERHRRGR